jgi:hypothetical protein
LQIYSAAHPYPLEKFELILDFNRVGKIMYKVMGCRTFLLEAVAAGDADGSNVDSGMSETKHLTPWPRQSPKGSGDAITTWKGPTTEVNKARISRFQQLQRITIEE